jgi:hypothetical protein
MQNTMMTMGRSQGLLSGVGSWPEFSCWRCSIFPQTKSTAAAHPIQNRNVRVGWVCVRLIYSGSLRHDSVSANLSRCQAKNRSVLASSPREKHARLYKKACRTLAFFLTTLYYKIYIWINSWTDKFWSWYRFNNFKPIGHKLSLTWDVVIAWEVYNSKSYVQTIKKMQPRCKWKFNILAIKLTMNRYQEQYHDYRDGSKIGYGIKEICRKIHSLISDHHDGHTT